MLLSSLNTAAVTTVSLIPAAAQVADSLITGVGKSTTMLNSALNVAEANVTAWEKSSLAALKLGADDEHAAAVTSAALKRAQQDHALDQALNRPGKTLNEYFESHHKRLNKL